MNPELTAFAELYRQNWENARHIKNERIWFMNTFSVISAGVLSLLQNIRTEPLLQVALLSFLCLFSVIGLLTSLRLKAELEECLGKLRVMVAQAGAGEFVALGAFGGSWTRNLKFRWIFPIFYSLAAMGFFALFLHRLLAGH